MSKGVEWPYVPDPLDAAVLKEAQGLVKDNNRLRAINAELLAALVKITDIIGAASGRKLPICLQIDEIARAAFERAKEAK